MKKGMAKTLAIGAAILVLLIVSAYAGNNWIQVTLNQIEPEGLPVEFDGFKIVHIGDLHAKEFGAGNARLARIIKKQKPDAILVTGDMINSQNDDGGTFIRLLEKLNGNYPVYCSLGNHEQIIENRELNGKTDVFNTLRTDRKRREPLLDNQRFEIKGADNQFGFTGLRRHCITTPAVIPPLGRCSIEKGVSGRKIGHGQSGPVQPVAGP